MKILYRGVFVENFPSPVLGPNFDLGWGGVQGSNINFKFFNPIKVTLLRENASFAPSRAKIHAGV